MQLKTSTLFDVSFFTLSASLQTWHGTQVIKASPVPHSRVALLLFLNQRANFSYTVQSSLAGKGSPPDLVMCLHVLLELWGCLELLPAGLAGVTAAPSQLLAVLLHVDGQLALQGELIPTLGADEILRGRGHPWACDAPEHGCLNHWRTECAHLGNKHGLASQKIHLGVQTWGYKKSLLCWQKHRENDERTLQLLSKVSCFKLTAG